MTNVSLSNANDFSITNGCMQALKGDESCSIVVEYLSAYDTSLSTTLSYTTNDSDYPTVSKTFKVGSGTIVPIINYLLF